MVKYRFWSFNAVLLLFTTLVSTAVLASPLGTFQSALGDFVVNVAFLGSLLDIFGSTSQAQLAGFMRVLYGVLAFCIWYFAGGFVFPEQRNIRISISVILSILSVVFIPEQVIIAITFGYSTLFSTILLGIAYGAIVAVVYFIPGDNRSATAIKVLILGALWWINGIVNDAVVGVAKANAKFGATINVGSITELLGFVNALLILVLGWQIGKLFLSEGYRQTFGDGFFGKGIRKGLGFGWKKFTPGNIGNQAAKDAAYLKSRELNDYVLEEKEAQTIHAAIASLDELEGAIEDSMNTHVITANDQQEIASHTQESINRIKDALHLADQLEEATFQAQRGITRMYRDIKRSGKGQNKALKFWQGELAELEAKEQKIHDEHDIVRAEMTEVRKRFQAYLVPFLGIIESIPSFPMNTGTPAKGRSTYYAYLDRVDHEINTLRGHLGVARDAALKAYKKAGEMAAYFEKYF